MFGLLKYSNGWARVCYTMARTGIILLASLNAHLFSNKWKTFITKKRDLFQNENKKTHIQATCPSTKTKGGRSFAYDKLQWSKRTVIRSVAPMIIIIWLLSNQFNIVGRFSEEESLCQTWNSSTQNVKCHNSWNKLRIITATKEQSNESVLFCFSLRFLLVDLIIYIYNKQTTMLSRLEYFSSIDCKIRCKQAFVNGTLCVYLYIIVYVFIGMRMTNHKLAVEMD